MVERNTAPLFVDTFNSVEDLLERMNGTARVAVDIESNGMFAYRPRVCTVQLAWLGKDGSTGVAIVDTLALSVTELAWLLESQEIIKVIHDLSFDARVLHLEGVDLRAVRDTSVAAVYLAKPATGLASLLKSELGVHVGKEMQNSDWARRPLSTESLAYLAGDVLHLLALDTLLAEEVTVADITDEVATETAYRLIDALETKPDQRPPHLRIKGNERLDAMGRRVLEAIASVREQIAEASNLPPQRIVGDGLLLAIADRRPQTIDAMLKFRALKRLNDTRRQALFDSIRAALNLGPASSPPPSARRPPTQSVIAARKRIERRLHAWRRSEAGRRSVHEQVVLPTHCIRRLVCGKMRTPEAIATLPGFGPARAKRYAERLAEMLADQTEHLDI